MTETWINNKSLANLSDFQINNYSLEMCCRNDRTGGGVGAYISCKLLYEVLDIQIIDSESLWIRFNIASQTTVIGVIYRPSTISNPEPFILSLDRVLNDLQCKDICCILCGDMNLDLMSLSISHSYIRTLFSYGFATTNVYPSRIADNSCTLLDHIHTNHTYSSISSGVIYNDISDHLATFAVFHSLLITPNERYKNSKCFRWDFRSYNKNKFLRELESCNMCEIINLHDPDEAYNLFLAKFSNCCNSNLKKTSIKKRSIPRKPWITNSLLKCTRKKNKLYAQTLIERENTALENKYKNYKNVLTNILPHVKQNYLVIVVMTLRRHGNTLKIF